MTDDLIKRELQAALDAWKDLAEWVRNTSKPHELGLHCAKVVRDRIEAQAAEIERLKREVMLQMGWKTEAQNEVERLRGIVAVWLDLAIGPDEMGDYYRQKQVIKASQEALGETE